MLASPCCACSALRYVCAPAVIGACSRLSTRVCVCAQWSTSQLLSEASRHKWGLVRAQVGDIPFGAAPEADAADSITGAMPEAAATIVDFREVTVQYATNKAPPDLGLDESVISAVG